MSKSIGKMFSPGSTNNYGYENNYTNYLRNYDTYNYDETANNMAATAYNMSQNLGSLPNYQFNVESGDAARQRAEDATYQAYVDKLTQVYQQQTSDLSNRLINQGIPVGSEAYNRAMQNLQTNQNDALNQAAYQSVLNGQDAYAQAFADNLRAAQFNNNARQSYIDQIRTLLGNSVSGYENMANLYNVQNGVQARQRADTQQGMDNFNSFLGSFMSGLGKTLI